MEPFHKVCGCLGELGLPRAGQRLIEKLCSLSEKGGAPQFSLMVKHCGTRRREAFFVILGIETEYRFSL